MSQRKLIFGYCGPIKGLKEAMRLAIEKEQEETELREKVKAEVKVPDRNGH
jgi:hypothetical protein